MARSGGVDIEMLSIDKTFEEYLDTLCYRNRIKDVDDYQQDVYLALLDSRVSTVKECRRYAKRLAERTAYRCRCERLRLLAFDEKRDSRYVFA